jgi:hypothetical protein
MISSSSKFFIIYFMFCIGNMFFHTTHSEKKITLRNWETWMFNQAICEVGGNFFKLYINYKFFIWRKAVINIIYAVRWNGMYSKSSIRTKVLMGVFRGPLPYYKNVILKIFHRKKMVHSVKNYVFHQILVNLSKYILKNSAVNWGGFTRFQTFTLKFPVTKKVNWNSMMAKHRRQFLDDFSV